MDFMELAKTRCSVRAYTDRKVEPEKLERILAAACLAPSACNAQPWKFVVVMEPELSARVGKAAAGLGMNKFAKNAPVHILVVEESIGWMGDWGAIFRVDWDALQFLSFLIRKAAHMGVFFILTGLLLFLFHAHPPFPDDSTVSMCRRALLYSNITLCNGFFFHFD